MIRIPEPELMDSPAQTKAYALADFSEPNGLFCQHLANFLTPDQGQLLDLGCGSGGLLVQMAHTLPHWQLIGVDAGPNMLALAQTALNDASLDPRVSVRHAHLPGDAQSLATLGPFDAIVSNSLLHHLKDPMSLWSSIQALGRPGTQIVVMDLERPQDLDEVERLVEAHTQGAHEVLRQDFYNSLCAAWRLDEVTDQLAACGWSDWTVARPSNRHWIVMGQL